jgi:MoaA/NifB/PqqE/SkfB family radical SAM enzyme
LDVDVTTTCQLACPMCPAGGSFESDFPGMGLFLDERLYQEALREAERLSMPSIRLGMTGEPLLISDIDRWAGEAKAAGFIDLALVTNGQLLSAEKSTLLIEAGLTKLMVSVDAATPETYAKMRPGGDFERLVENLEDFLAVRFAKSSRLPLLRLSFVVSSLNRSEMEAFRAKFSALADWLVFQDYLSLSPDPSLAPAGLPGPATGKAPEPPVRCPDPFARMALLSDGGLFPCCSDFARLAPLGRMPKDSIESVWRSPAAESLAGDPSHPSCRKCLAASSRGKPYTETTAASKEVRGQRSATC